MRYVLTNVRLEQGFQEANGWVDATKTALFHLVIEDGRIAQVLTAAEPLPEGLSQVDAKGLLALPSFTEKHVHLDKTYLGDRWRACRPVPDIFGRFEIEKNVLPTLATTTKERATQFIETILRNGSTHIRTHVDLYQEVGLRNLEQVQEALAAYEGKLTYEIVAFPQHGLLRNQCADLVRAAVRQGCDLVGGVDPATVDGDLEASLQQMVEIAVEGNVGIDLHLHDRGALGAFTMKRLAELTIEAGLQGRVAVSHAFALADLTTEGRADLVAMFKEAGVTIISSVPIGREMPPLHQLAQEGVNVAIGCDNVFDSWSPFGNGDILERLGRLAEISRWSNERSLNQAVRFITGGRTTLSETGAVAWPKVGDEASLVLANASCVAEAVARRAPRPAVFFRGRLVAGSL